MIALIGMSHLTTSPLTLAMLSHTPNMELLDRLYAGLESKLCMFVTNLFHNEFFSTFTHHHHLYESNMEIIYQTDPNTSILLRCSYLTP